MTAAAGRRIGWALAVVTLVCVGVARWLFPRAQPTIALDQRLTPALAIAAARDFATAHDLPVAGADVAVRFDQDVETQTYLELAAGGKPAVNAAVRGTDLALFSWGVRFYRPGDPREVRVWLAPDGRVLGFRRTLAQDDARPALDSATAFGVADSVRRTWWPSPPGTWSLVAASVTTVAPAGRLDRTFTWERTDRRVGEAPLRFDLVVRGDLPGGALPSLRIPDDFTRRYRERRADNELYATIASATVPLIAILGLVGMAGAGRRVGLRWRPALAAGVVIGALMAAAHLNDLPQSWYDYDTATSPMTHLVNEGVTAASIFVGLALVSAVLLAMGEVLTREAFPAHYDWWGTARYAGTRPVAMRLLGGYAVAAFGLAYVSVFYLAAQRLGWWSPSALLDDPNRIATPLPWLSAIANALQAGVLEEVLFRAVPLALVARAVRDQPWRRPAMAGAVVLSALIFGFAHANYASWPAYARGVELFVEAVLWAVLYLRVGLVTTIVGHCLYDLVLFGLFAAAGTAAPYRVSLGIVALAAALPALLVAWRAWRGGGLADAAPAEARFGAWQPVVVAAPEASPVAEAPVAEAPLAPVAQPPVAARPIGAGLGLVAVAALVAAGWPIGRRATPRFTADRAQVIATADSLLRTLGERPDGWRRLVDAQPVGSGGAWRFLAANGATPAEEAALERTWLHAGQWSVRYVHPDTTLAARTEQWELVLEADGTPHTWEHVLPDTVAAPTVAPDSTVALARAALVAAGARAEALVLQGREVTARPARQDVTVTFDDTSVAVPAGGAARRFAVVAGDRVVRVGHSVFIPETWARTDARDRGARASLAGALTFGFVVAWLVVLVVVLRRPARVGPAPWPPVRTLTAWLAAAGGVAVLVAANTWEARLAGWDSATPWDRHRLFVGLGLIGTALLPTGLALLWRATDALRQRAGLPLRAASPGAALVDGACLTLVPTCFASLPRHLLPEPPVLPDTVLDTAVPWLATLLGPLADGLGTAAGVALVAGGIVAWRAPAVRWTVVLLAAVVLGIQAGAIAALTPTDWLVRAAVQGTAALAAAGVIWWRRGGTLESWAVAGLLWAGAGTTQAALTAATPVDAVAHALALGPIALVVMKLVHARR